MKKNFTFNIESKYGDFLRRLKNVDKRSINNQVEYIFEYYCKSEYGCDVSEFVKFIDSENNQGFYIPM